MSDEKRSFSRIPVRLKANARIMQSLDSPQLFTGDATAPISAREDIFRKSKLPEELTSFLTEMDRKLDRVLAMLSQETMQNDFSIDIQVMELSGAGIKFRTSDRYGLAPNMPMEIVMQLSQVPLRMAGSKGRILDREEDTGLYRFEFVDMRGTDMEAIVQFVFQQQREQIRNSKM